MKSTAYALLMIILAASTVVSAKRPDMNVKVDSLELNVQSLNDSIQSVLELMRTIQSTVDKQGTCMSDLSSSNCPDGKDGKDGVVYGINDNKARIKSNRARIFINKAIWWKKYILNRDDIQKNMADINNIMAMASIPAYYSDWTIIQRRGQYGNDEDYFDKDFKDYENGFGSVYGELWIGLKKLADLTKDGKWELQVDLTEHMDYIWDDTKWQAKYATFSVGPAPTYRLHVGGFKDGESTLGDSMEYHNGQAFSARDKDQDASWSINTCAVTSGGGWWYNNCYRANLNGFNHAHQSTDYKGIQWWLSKSGETCSTCFTWKASVMKIRRMKLHPSLFSGKNDKTP